MKLRTLRLQERFMHSWGAQSRVATYVEASTHSIYFGALIGVANVASGPDWRQSVTRLVDILIAGSRPINTV